jgi:short subunit dehydrogenase-like uncharacterized protein
MPWMIYGASGYTGSRIAERAVQRGQTPVLAGRNAERVRSVAKRLGLRWTAFELTEASAVARAISEVGVLLNAAGPFVRTSEPLLQACLAMRVHYLDITGEIDVFERCAALGPRAHDREVMLMPGVGFDMVPGDCLAAHLADRVPDAHKLDIGFRYDGPMTRGSAKSSLIVFPQGALVRRAGSLRPLGARASRSFDFGAGPEDCPAITFGDLCVAWHTTRIPNITSYTRFARPIRIALDAASHVSGLLARPRVISMIERLVDRLPEGPSAAQLEKYGAVLVAEVRGLDGRSAMGRLCLPNVYAMTFDTATMIVDRVCAGQAPPGFRTPAGVFGADFVLSVPGCTREDLTTSRDGAVPRSAPSTGGDNEPR